MKILGIVAEYNPFHNGHLYQLNEARKQIQPDHCIAVMSGSFLQRGEAALFDKYTRCRMALTGGLDAVYELPAYFACSSAEEFAAAAIITMKHLSVTHVAFGAECDDLHLLSALAKVTVTKEAALNKLLLEQLSYGATYACAYTRALCQCSHIPEAETVLNQPNNMLALCYLRAIFRYCPNMKPVLIQRTQAMYHDTDIHGSIASASAIRNVLLDNPDADLSNIIPGSCVNLLPHKYLTNEDLTTFAGYALYHAKNQDLSMIYDISNDLSNRIQKHNCLVYSYASLIQDLKTRQYTYTRISRSILHLLLDMRQDIFSDAKKNEYIYYVRLLGFRHTSSSLISFQKKNCMIPFIQKVSKAGIQLSDTRTALTLFQADIQAHQLYRLAWFTKHHETLPSDYEQNAIIV